MINEFLINSGDLIEISSNGGYEHLRIFSTGEHCINNIHVSEIYYNSLTKVILLRQPLIFITRGKEYSLYCALYKNRIIFFSNIDDPDLILKKSI